jgi:hypothetical protein
MGSGECHEGLCRLGIPLCPTPAATASRVSTSADAPRAFFGQPPGKVVAPPTQDIRGTTGVTVTILQRHLCVASPSSGTGHVRGSEA